MSMACTSFAISAFIAGAPPLNGTCTSCSPAARAKISMARCGSVAVDGEP
jgi:hypothetical protein